MPFSVSKVAPTPVEKQAEGEWNALIFSKAEDGLVPVGALEARVEELSREGHDERADALAHYRSSCRL